jgi:hypothetical protein
VGGACGIHGRGVKNIQCFGGKPKGKSLLERPWCRWEDGIRMDLRDVGGGGCMEWICLAQNRDWLRVLMNVVVNLWVLVLHSLLVH